MRAQRGRQAAVGGAVSLLNRGGTEKWRGLDWGEGRGASPSSVKTEGNGEQSEG